MGAASALCSRNGRNPGEVLATPALLPLLVEEARSAQVRELLETDPEIVVWWGTPVECWSAIARLHREHRIGASDQDLVGALLGRLRAAWIEILPGEEVRNRAMRMVRIHSLRTLDAFQLAAAVVWSGTPAGDGFVTFDRRLEAAARAEGFTPSLTPWRRRDPVPS